ncbi:MAG: M1 family metallopeptidase [Ferruginibacter sp.]|nr:M1 family metallopeptidase [Cytophagales bacterium]
MKKTWLLLSVPLLLANGAQAQTDAPDKANAQFEQLGPLLPTPNAHRTAAGTPGPDYYQQQADYDIRVELDDERQRITGSETITYTNRSPQTLPYLWLQLDQNLFNRESDGFKTRTGTLAGNAQPFTALNFVARAKFDGGFKITAVKDQAGKDLPYVINQTMMRVDLPGPLKPNGRYSFSVAWNYNINDLSQIGGRCGYERFADGNCAYEIAQWFPRMAVYNDVTGWQHKQFLGQGEFTLPFGDYRVAITVPADHVVGATGELLNAAKVLGTVQRNRLQKAETSRTPLEIVTPDEAGAAAKNKSAARKTWVFAARNVRDFAFATSRRFIWDAMRVEVAGKKVWAMSYYPPEGNPLWGKYSTQAVAHTLRTYSRYTIDYPYPVAISVNWAGGGGMEYPMICFNGGRPQADGTYAEGLKYGLISVVIHEVGHNFFPMIINSDERQWSWMDEGLNSFCQYMAEQEWQRDYPSRRGEPQKIVPYMSSDPATLSPIMSSSDNIVQFGPNAYGKPATALNILRETVMGRPLFDYAFREYARRWAFKHPEPADFFRTMEDASGVDLDWFWKGWFYGTKPVEISLENVSYHQAGTQDPDREKPLAKAEAQAKARTLSKLRNDSLIKQTVLEADPSLADFYNSYDPYAPTPTDQSDYQAYTRALSAEEKALLNAGHHFYTMEFKNNGGLVMPIIVGLDYEDGTSEVVRIPAEVWRLNDEVVSKVLPTTKKVKSFTLDPFFETADINLANNSFPRRPVPTRFQLYKQQQSRPSNPMQTGGKANASQPSR